MSKLTILIKDLMSGFEVIKSYKMLSHSEQSFDDENKTTIKLKYGVDSITAAVESVSVVLSSAILIVAFCVAVYLIIMGNITVGVLMGVLQVSAQIVNPIQILSQSIPKIYFKYQNGNEVLRGVRCKFKKGKKYAIIGKSGKTTLIRKTKSS